MSQIVTIDLDCGMTLVAEPIASGGIASVALNWLVPAGSATDPPHGDGYAALLSELILRGAGTLTSREHSDALDRLGVQRSTGVQTHHLRIEATMLGSRLHAALPLIADMVRAPALPADAIDPVRSLCLQALDSLNDEPQHLTMLRLRQRHHPAPINRHGYGEREVLDNATIEEVRESWTQRCRPVGSILGVAGAVNPHALAAQLNELLRGWTGEPTAPGETASPERGYLHLEQATAQVHIGLAYDAPPENHKSSMIERLAIGVLSGSTSGRLFTEVRQKRSLCYSVGASYRAGRDTGLVSLYAGTTPERAQETLDVCRAEIERMKAGVTQAEFNRAANSLKARQIMQGESTQARAAALVYDQFRVGRARTLEEVARIIDSITIEQLNRYVAAREFGQFTIVSLGPAPLQTGQPAQIEESKVQMAK
ncbi:MAG: insulinase family protein [Phycisphaerales bacterium]|nr:insulinase family protein [Phycisphaerales bacterium]